MPEFFNINVLTLNMSHIIAFVLLFAIMLIYFKIAGKYHIVNEPGVQSSHDYVTIRGGGIVFWAAGVLFTMMNLPQSLLFLLGFTLICGVSFWDDISSLSPWIRLVVQFVAVGIIVYDLDLPFSTPWWLILTMCVVSVGIINAYNFMDGINGMTGLNSLVILLSLQYVNQNVVAFTRPDFIIYAILSCLVFLFFNARKQAKCFAGDIGSIGIAFWIVALLLQLMRTTYETVWLLFLAVYGVDAVCTIVHRIFMKHNILKPHRLHFYQVWIQKTTCSHLFVSVIYAAFQLIICVIVIGLKDKMPELMLVSTLVGLLVALYTLKFQYEFNDIEAID